VRRPLLAAVGALVLQLSLLSTAYAIVPTPTSPSSSDTSSSSSSSSTSSTRKPTSSSNTTSSTKGTRPEPGVGEMSIEPTSGPPGTVISVASVTPSPLHGDQVAHVALVKVGAKQPSALVTFDVRENGSWAGSLVVPSNAAPGAYFVAALVEVTDEIASGGEDGNHEAPTTFAYVPLAFEVTPAPNRPPIVPSRPSQPSQPSQPSVPPVVTTPSLTG
jgi:hypothetical protein